MVSLQSHLGLVFRSGKKEGGRKRGREGEWEGGRKRGREGEWEGGRKRGREGGRDREWEGGSERGLTMKLSIWYNVQDIYRFIILYVL